MKSSLVQSMYTKDYLISKSLRYTSTLVWIFLFCKKSNNMSKYFHFFNIRYQLSESLSDNWSRYLKIVVWEAQLDKCVPIRSYTSCPNLSD